MKKVILILLTISFSGYVYACDPFGWMLVKQGSLSISERVCTYEKNGYQMSIVVNGFCPMNPCQR